MVGGLASVAGSILAGYAGLGVELKYLITKKVFQFTLLFNYNIYLRVTKLLIYIFIFHRISLNTLFYNQKLK